MEHTTRFPMKWQNHRKSSSLIVEISVLKIATNL